MTKIYTGASMSLDGYVSGPQESGFEHLFQWYGNGDVVVETGDPNLTMRMTEMGAAHFRGLIERTGALVVGRKLYDLMDAWGGRHPMDVPVVVLTHNPPRPDDESFVFVTGIEAAVEKAKELAGGKAVGLNAGEVARQALEAQLVDEVWIDLVPVLLGGGTPFFDHVKTAPVVLEGPLSIGDDRAVTHLRYRVRSA